MKKRFLALIIVIVLMLSNIITGHAQDNQEHLDFNLFDVVNVISDEFVAETNAMIQRNWDENYFSLITLEMGSMEMNVDGKLEAMSAPAFMEDGELKLPIIDIVRAVGADISMDIMSDQVIIFEDGEITTIDSNEIGLQVAPDGEEYITPFSGALLIPSNGHQQTAQAFVSSADEVETALKLNVDTDGNSIFITKPYQLKQIILYVRGGGNLRNNHGADKYITDGHGLYFLQYSTENLTRLAYEAFKNDKSVQFVELNKVVQASHSLTATSLAQPFDLANRWGTERISADTMKIHLQNTGKTNTSKIVAVLDTGVEVSHPFLQSRTILGFNFIDNNSNAYDTHGHGTHVSGIIVDTTPDNVLIMPVKVLNDSGKGDHFSVSLGIRYAADKGADIINMSLSSICSDNNCINRQAIDYAMKKGVTAVAAAGNDRTDTVTVCPANIDTVLTVTATDQGDVPGNFTNFGDAVDICTPGVNIMSCIPGGNYAYMSGTSMSAAYVSATVAMLSLEYPDFGPQQLKTVVKNTTIDLGIQGCDRLFGTGVVDFRVFFGTGAILPNFIILNHTQATLEKNSSSGEIDLYAYIYPANATNKSIRFTSSNENVAIYRDGRVVAVGAGTAVITVTTINGLRSTCTVTVTEFDFVANLNAALRDALSGVEFTSEQVAALDSSLNALQTNLKEPGSQAADVIYAILFNTVDDYGNVIQNIVAPVISQLSDEAFVRLLYQMLLPRMNNEVLEEGVAFWTRLLELDESNPDRIDREVLFNIFTDYGNTFNEYLQQNGFNASYSYTMKVVRDLYWNVFHWRHTGGGFTWWLDAFDNGRSFEQVFADFFFILIDRSEEYPTDDFQFVVRLFNAYYECGVAGNISEFNRILDQLKFYQEHYQDQDQDARWRLVVYFLESNGGTMGYNGIERFEYVVQSQSSELIAFDEQKTVADTDNGANNDIDNDADGVSYEEDEDTDEDCDIGAESRAVYDRRRGKHAMGAL